MRRHLHTGWKHFWKQIFRVARNPIFAILTLCGNAVLATCACLFYILESGINPKLHTLYDGFWWALITMTTVGYGDIVPITTAGRCVAIILIFTGGVLFLSFIALLSSAFVELEFSELESEVAELKDEVSKLRQK